MNKLILGSCALISAMFLQTSHAQPYNYAHQLCQQNGYHCITVQKGDTWQTLFPHHVDRDIVKRLNRMNIPLKLGMKIAVPDRLTRLDKMDLSPFYYSIAPQKSRLIVVSLAKLAWGAYDKNGQLLNWGPIAGGKDWCEDTDEDCQTVKGEFHLTRAEGEECVSKTFPVETRYREAGGAVMPYCMFFHGGYALHGSYNLPGYNASHGCVRMLTEDARWLFYEFIEIPGFRGGKEQTKVIVE